MADIQAFLTRQQVAQRYGITDRTVDRWEKDYAIGFPAAMLINGRRFFSVTALEQWERARAASNAQAA